MSTKRAMRPPSTQLLRAFNSTGWRSSYSTSLTSKTTSRSLHPNQRQACCKKSITQGSQNRGIHTASHLYASAPPKSTDRGPVSDEDTQTDFSTLNVLGGTAAPTTSIDACLPDGFIFDSGLRIIGGSGCILVGGEAFSWKPWKGRNGRLINSKGQWECADEAWGVLDLVWPKPDMLILGLGPSMAPIAPKTKACINSLGIRIEVQDTRNAAAQFNLLATERGVGNIAAAFVPIGWRDGR